MLFRSVSQSRYHECFSLIEIINFCIIQIFNVNNTELASTEDKGKYYFLYMQHSTDIFFGTVLCEFSVYRQEGRETERITQFCVRTELGASHD